MSDIYGKRPSADTYSSTYVKRVKYISSIGQSTASSPGNQWENERDQPVAEFGNGWLKTPPSPLAYSERIILQPEELLVYSLIKISSPDGKINAVKGYFPEKFSGISKAVYDVYGIRFDCTNLRNYFYRSINNLTKGLGKYKGLLRWKFYNKNVEKIVTTYNSILINLLLDSKSLSAQNYHDLRNCLESECLCLE